MSLLQLFWQFMLVRKLMDFTIIQSSKLLQSNEASNRFPALFTKLLLTPTPVNPTYV